MFDKFYQLYLASSQDIWELFFWGLGLYLFLYFFWLLIIHLIVKFAPLFDKVLKTRVQYKAVEGTVYFWFISTLLIHTVLVLGFGINPILKQWRLLHAELLKSTVDALEYIVNLLQIAAMTWVPLLILVILNSRLAWSYGKKIQRVDIYK